MNRVASSMFVSLSLLSACSSGASTPPSSAPAKPAPVPTPAESPKPPAVADMDASIQALMANPEVPDASIEIQHVLISFKGAIPKPTLTRSKDEAKVLAQKVYAEAVGGADFLGLVKQYTDDSAPGIYPITKAGRRRYVKAFGDVGFRLQVGEIGVAPWEKLASPFGWHIIKRLK